MKNFTSWIDIEYKLCYLDSKKKGIHVVAGKDVSASIISLVRDYLKFIRKRYFFPIRCYIYLTNTNKYKSKNSGYCKGVFFPGEENKSGLPSIYLPVKQSDSSINEILFNLTCLLTYYYQWYFKLENKYSHRSLEIEATKMAAYLVDDFVIKASS